MRRWPWVALVGLLACGEQRSKLPGQGMEPDCTSASGNALPRQGTDTSASSQASEDPSRIARDGREPFLIRFRRTVSAAAATQAAADAVARTGGAVTIRWPRLGAVAARLSHEERATLANHPDVLSIEPDWPVYALARQPPVTSGSVGEYTEGLKLVQAPEVWDANNDGILDVGAPIGAGIKVCVIDTGWDSRHPELQAAYGSGKDFIDGDDDPQDFDTLTGEWGGGHGMHTTATIAAQLASAGTTSPGDEPNGVVGVAPGVELLIARVLDGKGRGSTSALISAVEWCQQQGARIASLSLGSQQRSETAEAAFDAALAAGMLSIAATGNDGTGDPATEPGVGFPAGYRSVLAVGAVNMKKERATFSQVGPQVALVAPGVGVLSAVDREGGDPYSVVEIDGRTFESRALRFAPKGEYAGKLVSCGVGGSPAACGGKSTCEGFVAYVERGGVDDQGVRLTFAKKVTQMRKAGARAVIIGNNDPSGGVGDFELNARGQWVPTASITATDGATLLGLEEKTASVRLIGTDYARLQGTSMSTPHVSGVAALVWSARPGLTPTQVRALLEDSAEDLGSAGRDPIFGFGLVRAKEAMRLLESRYPAVP